MNAVKLTHHDPFYGPHYHPGIYSPVAQQFTLFQPMITAFNLDRQTYPAYYSSAGWMPMYGASIHPTSFRGPVIRPGGTIVNMHFLTSALKSIEPRIDDDLVDRLNYYYTPSVILIFAILVSAKQYVGHPIECWVPAQFTKAMEQYTENYCWVQNTYWVPFSDRIPYRLEHRERRQIGYYQWVPFVLAVQALLFYVPAILWRMLSSQSGINVYGILQMVNDEHNVEPENRVRTAHILARHIDDALRHQRDFSAREKPIYLWAFLRIGKFYGAYVTTLYCCIKMAYFFNAIGQFFLINKFLETDGYPYYGINVLRDLLSGNEWQNSGKFPRVTLCDFEIRALGNVHRHSVQCCLVINLFTEKIFIFLWLWYLFLAFLCLASLIYWLATASLPILRMRFVLNQLELTDTPITEPGEAKRLRKFVCAFLRPDGVFILRMIGWHGGTVLLTEIVHILWLKYWDTYAEPSEGSAVKIREILSSLEDKTKSDEKPASTSDVVVSLPGEESKETTPPKSPQLSEPKQATPDPDSASVRSLQRLKDKFKLPKRFKFSTAN